MSDRLSTKQIKILESLATYQYLTISQFARLGVDGYRSNISTQLKGLRDKKKNLVDRISDGGMNDFEDVYFLTKYGAEVIAEHIETDIEGIKMPRSKPKRWQQSYYHRRSSTDCQIELYLSASEYEVELYYKETERTGNTRRDNNLARKTRIDTRGGYLEPDAIFKLDTTKGSKLYLFEMERRDNRTKKQLEEKLRKHVHALNMKSASRLYNHKKAHRVLFVFEHEATMKFAIDFLKKNVEGADFWFLFKLYDEVVPGWVAPKGKFAFGEIKDYSQNWLTVSGKRVDMF